MKPEIEKRDGGWAVIHYTGSGWILDHFATEEEARKKAKEAAERIYASNEFILVLQVSEAHFPRR